MAHGYVTRFDHAVIAVDHLDAGIKAYRELGFDVVYGGAHTNRGTHNAIIRFGLDYIELISVHDRALAAAAGGNVADLVSYCDRTGGGLLGFALAATDLDAVAADWTSESPAAGKPINMERIRPDGLRLSWRLLIPAGSAWRKPWPFLIQWDTPDVERVQRDTGGVHTNGAKAVGSVSVITRSAHKLAALYEHDLGLDRADGNATDFSVGAVSIHVVEPQAGVLQAALERDGEGLCELELVVDDLGASRLLLGLAPDPSGRVVIPAELACGARIVLSERR